MSRSNFLKSFLMSSFHFERALEGLLVVVSLLSLVVVMINEEAIVILTYSLAQWSRCQVSFDGDSSSCFCFCGWGGDFRGLNA